MENIIQASTSHGTLHARLVSTVDPCFTTNGIGQTEMVELLSTPSRLKPAPPPVPQVLQVPQPFRMPENLSDRLQWRLVNFFKSVWKLSRNEQGFCWATSRHHLCKWHDCSEATIRRWIAILVEHGWLRAEILGPNRHLYPLVTPREIVAFWPRFKRLLRRVLSGFSPSLSLDTDKYLNSNTQRKAESLADVPADARDVAVKAISVGVREDQVPKLVRECGPINLNDAISYFQYGYFCTSPASVKSA